MKTRLRLIFVVLFCVAASGALKPLQAQIYCEGSACSLLPLSTDDLNIMLYSFKYQYADELFQDMAEAATTANIAGLPIGTVNLHGFTTGGYMGVGVRLPREIPVYIPGVGSLDPLPSAGIGVNPRVFVGVNVGWLLGMGYTPFGLEPTPSMISPARFDVYLTGVEYVNNQSRGGFDGFEPKVTADSAGNTQVKLVARQNETSLNVQAFSRGAELRYHLVEGIGPSSLARWYGLSAGLGHSVSRQEIEMTQAQSKLGFKVQVSGQNADLVWQGQNFLNWNTRISTTTADVKTGVQFLYLFNFTVAVGGAYSSGKSKFIMSRTGPVYLTSDQLALYGIQIPDAFLTLILTGEGKARPFTPYAKVGIGINLGPMKIDVEALYTPDVRDIGGSVGARLEF